MGLPEICIRRPVFATVLSLMLLLIGIVSYERLTVREYPNIDEPVVSVTTSYPGASAQIIETQITQILEGSIAGIENIDILESTSRAESSRITVRFNIKADPEASANDVRDRVSRVRSRLPDEVDEPVIRKVEADASPIINLVFSNKNMNALQITDYVDRYVLDRLKNLTGVADVVIYGERRYAMRIWIDREKLAAYNLTVQDVENALRSQNVELPAGRIESVDREFTVLSRTGLRTPTEFGRVRVKVTDGYQVRLREVARVELGAADERRVSTYNGGQAINVGVIKQAVANPLDVSQALREVLPEINQSLPEGMTAEVANDSAVFIDRSIQAVFVTMLEAVALVVIVIIVFLRSLRASLIPIVTIPISLIATFGLMYAMGFSINTLTLLAMVLAIGLVVDDAIVVLENIYRKVENGMRPFEAAIEGSREISFAVVAMTLTLAAVYAPIAFAPGRVGRLFLEFALTLAGAVLVSGFVALTLTPMMCSKILRHNPSPGRLFRFVEGAFEGVENGYRRMLGGSLRIAWLIIVAALAIAASSAFFFLNLKSELAPVEDRGLVQVRGNSPEGSTIGYTSRYSQQVANILQEVPEMEGVLTVVGQPEITNMRSTGRLKDWDDRQRSQQEIVDEVSAKLRRIPGLRANATNAPSFGARGGGRPVEFVLQSSSTYEQLQEHVDKLLAAIEGNPVLTNIDSDLELNKPEFTMRLNRPKIADLGLDVSVVGRTLETLLGGRQVTRFEVDGEQYDVYIQLAAQDRSSPQALSTIFLRSPSGEMVQLSNVVTIQETVAPKELKRFNQLRAVTISANLNPGYALSDGIAVLERAAAEALPGTVRTDLAGTSREFRASGQSLMLVFLLALAFIYLVLSAQFESFRDPVMIMLTVPLSITGALGALWLTGGTINVYSQIGLITLVGLITKHGILIVEFANQRQEAGLRRRDAIIEAATLRLRPILMTTGAMVFGAVPLAIAEGAGAESRQQIGWVIVGGMTLGTLLTLFVVPAVYSVFGRRHVESHSAEPAGVPAPAE
jgi:multidrug efflux pump